MARKRPLPSHFADTLQVAVKAKRYVVSSDPNPFDWSYSMTGDEKVFIHSPSIWRIVVLGIVALAVAFILLGRLASLQLIHGASYRGRSEENRIVLRTVNAPRGVIYDRYRTVLARNIPGFRQRVRGDTQESVRLLSYEEVLKQSLATNSAEIEIDALRVYQEPSLAHTIGYVSEITGEELAYDTVGYHLGDRIGRGGLEAAYEEVLRGKSGKDLAEVDAQGKQLRVLQTQPAVGGQALLTTLDAKLQATLSASLAQEVARVGGKGAAAVVFEAKTGGVLALISLPSFDPHLFTIQSAKENVIRVLDDPYFPLLHRALSASYPPGSTFKLVTAMAGLTEGKITKDTLIEDTGELFLGPYRFPNWYWVQYGKKEGVLNIVRALARSNDIFFYRAAEWTTPGALARLAKMMGLGSPTGVDIPGELGGLIPDEEWKRMVKKEPWLPGNTYHMGIGQGDVLTTPLQVALLTSVVATKGVKATPHLAQAVVDEQGNLVREYSFPIQEVSGIADEHWDLVREGMRQACREGGTGWPFFTFQMEVGCKTGTAEYGAAGKAHAWFTLFAPFENPDIVVTVLIEGGGEGSSVAGPVARKAMDWWVAQRR